MSRIVRLFPDEPAVGLRQHSGRRHAKDRRSHERGTIDRRRRRRRRFGIRSGVIGLATLAIPTSGKLPPRLKHVVGPSVSTTVTSFKPIPPELGGRVSMFPAFHADVVRDDPRLPVNVMTMGQPR